MYNALAFTRAGHLVCCNGNPLWQEPPLETENAESIATPVRLNECTTVKYGNGKA